MTQAKTTDRGIAWYSDGSPDAPAILLLHSLGASHDIWAPQISALSSHLRVIRMDARGHGQSTAPAGDYTLDDLGADVLGVLDTAGIARAHVCGVSMGGMMAMWLAAHAPERVRTLLPVSTALRIGTPVGWQERISQVNAAGVESIADVAMSRWLTDPFRRARPDVVEWCRRMLTGCPDAGYVSCCAVLRDSDLHTAASRIVAPTLVMVGDSDPVTPPSDAQEIRDHISGAQLLRFDASHICTVERADEFNRAVLHFVGASHGL